MQNYLIFGRQRSPFIVYLHCWLFFSFVQGEDNLVATLQERLRLAQRSEGCAFSPHRSAVQSMGIVGWGRLYAGEHLRLARKPVCATSKLHQTPIKKLHFYLESLEA